MRATLRPMLPMPTRPSTLPDTSLPIRSSREKPRLRRSWRSLALMRRETSSIVPIVCSATDCALAPAWLTTSTPAAVQAGMSMVSHPAPAAETHNSLGERASKYGFANQQSRNSSFAEDIW
jgi:hypothetical protein